MKIVCETERHLDRKKSAKWKMNEKPSNNIEIYDSQLKDQTNFLIRINCNKFS